MMEPIILPRISDKKPLVSVVSITYNHEAYIRDCLEGFLMQKTDFPIEVIIHDDASTDHTADIIREYYEKRPDLFYLIIEKENQYYRKDILVPLFRQAQGKYVALCEGDDYWIDPLKLQSQFDFMETHSGYSICFHNTIIKDMRNNQTRECYSKIPDCDFSLDAIILNIVPFMKTASIFFRSDLVSLIPEYQKGSPVGDFPLAICMANNGKAHYINRVMSVYRFCSATGSWSYYTYSNKSKQLHYYNSFISWFERIKELVRNNKTIDIRISRLSLTVDLLNENYKGYRSIHLRKMYNRLSFKGRILFFFFYTTLFVYSKVHFSILNKILHLLRYYIFKSDGITTFFSNDNNGGLVLDVKWC